MCEMRKDGVSNRRAQMFGQVVAQRMLQVPGVWNDFKYAQL